MAREYRTIDGASYTRRIGIDKFWIIADDNPTKEKPGIICDCGSSAFTLRYGDYELFARCMNCKVEDSIYSG